MSEEQDQAVGGTWQHVEALRDVFLAGRDQTINIYDQPQDQATAHSSIIVGDIPQRPPGFQLRTKLMAELNVTESDVSVVHAVTGMRGVGKTQLAAAYARVKISDRWRLVAWINAEDSNSLTKGLAAVAEAVGISVSGTTDAGLIVRNWLEADGDQRLIVFDNAIDADVLRKYVPAAGGARVVITSNSQTMTNLGAKIEVGVFTPTESVAYLTSRNSLIDTVGAAGVAEELGYLPLALAQAAAVINAQRLTYQTYLERLRAISVAEYLVREVGQSYPYGAAEAILFSVDALSAADRSGMSIKVLELVSVMSASGVRRDLLHAAVQLVPSGDGPREQNVQIIMDNALGKLTERSLASLSLDGSTVTVHRLVRRVVRDQLARQERLTAVCKIAASPILDRSHPPSWERWDKLDISSHAIAIASALSADKSPNIVTKRLIAVLKILRNSIVHDMNRGRLAEIIFRQPY